MKTPIKLMAALLVAVTVLASHRALAAPSTNFWTNAVSSVWNWSTAGNWDSGTVPSTTNNWVIFTNKAVTAYTVQLSGVSTSGPVRVTSDKVTFDVNGYKWVAYEANDTYGGDANLTHWISANAGETSTITFSSSQIPLVTGGNVVDFVNGRGGNLGMQVGRTTLTIDKSLGNAVTVIWGNNLGVSGAKITIDGAGSELRQVNAYASSYAGVFQVLNGGLLNLQGGSGWTLGDYSVISSTVLVNNAEMQSATFGGLNLGNGLKGTVVLTNNAVWRAASTVTVGNNITYNPADGIHGDLLLDNSKFLSSAGIVVGNADVNSAVGRVQVLNGSTMALSNGWLLIRGKGYYGPTNSFILKDSTLYLGSASAKGAITNRGILRAQGTITGNGSGNFLLRNEGLFNVGGSPGVLTLNKGNVESAAGSKTTFEFSDTALSQIVASNGYVSLLGTNLFSLAAGAPAPTNGVKYGLGTYDFVIGTTVSNAPQYDNLVNLLTNTYHLTYGVDFQYGVVNLGGGLFALELAFVPEPSTVLLLALGGLMVWRRIAKGRRKSGKTAGAALIAVALVLALAGGSALAQTSNFWNNPTGVQDWSTAGNWSAGSVPANPTTFVLFTNKAASAYTVQFSNVSTSGTLRVTTDKTTLDLRGYKWRVTSTGYYSPGPASPWISYGVGETSTVVFSSSAAPAVTGGNTFDIASDVYDGMGIGAGAVVRIDDSLGYAVNMKVPYNIFDGGSLTVSGAGVTLYALTAQGSVGGVGSSALIERGAILSNGFGQVASGGLFTVNNARMVEPSFIVGGIGSGKMIVTNNGVVLVTGGITVGYNSGYGTLTANGSSLYGQTLAIGSGPSYAAAGNVTIENGAMLNLSNGVSSLLVTTYWQQPGITNFLTLNNATIRLGGSGGNGLLSNASIMKATGTISGQGAGNFLLLNDAGGQLTIGNSPGVLTVNKGNVQLAANSKTFFQFSDTAASKLVVTNGFVSLLGSNVFSLAAGAPSPTNGVKYGLGVYDFVIATNINRTPQYDNLVNLLTNTYHLTYGVDFQYGVVNLGGGLFALELAFVPEPSTVMLLALGGLLVWRRMAKRQSKRE